MDSCVTPLRIGREARLVQTTDFFYPLVDDPYQQGRIAAANVLSDLYAMGVDGCDNMLMLLGVAEGMSEAERDAVLPLLLGGFRDAAAEAGCGVEGGQTVLNPWLLVGGVATAVALPAQIIMPSGALPGDLLVLTKPLGTQVAVNAWEWMRSKDPKRWAKVAEVASEEAVEKAYLRAMDSMGRLNRHAARLMHKFAAHAATDVTGFGILGHAKNLAECQTRPVHFLVQRLPVIRDMAEVNEAVGSMFGLGRGTSAETSGGLLVALPKEAAEPFVEELSSVQGSPAFVVGEVQEASSETSSASIAQPPSFFPVPSQDTPDQLW